MKGIAIACLAIGALGACATAGESPANREQRVAQRADQYWQAVVKNDYKAIYGLMTPGYRERFSYEQHIIKNSKPIARFLSAKVDKVACATADACTATIQVTMDKIQGVRWQGTDSTSFDDKWILVDGDWWRFPPN